MFAPSNFSVLGQNVPQEGMCKEREGTAMLQMHTKLRETLHIISV